MKMKTTSRELMKTMEVGMNAQGRLYLILLSVSFVVSVEAVFVP